MASLNFIIKYQIYPFDLMVSIGQTTDELINSLRKKGVEYNDDCKIMPNGLARTIMFEGGQTLIILPNIPQSCLEYGVLAHEIFHAVDFLMNRIGISLCPASNEAYAYLIGYITKEIYKKM